MTTSVTADDFFTRFSQFADADEDQITALITEAARQVDSDNWAADDIVPATLYLTAHLYMLETSAVDAGTEVGGAIASESFGPLSVSYANPGGTQSGTIDEIMTTTYGRRFAEIRSRNVTGPVVI
jgi:uncharacterized protein DUF4054